MTAAGRVESIDQFVHRAIAHGVGIKSAVIEHCGLARGLPVTRVNHRLIVVGRHGADSLGFANMNGYRSKLIGKEVCGDKEETRRRLASAGLSVAVSRQYEIGDFDRAVAHLQQMECPAVVKPSNRSRGRGVTTDVRTHRDLELAWQSVLAHRRTRVPTKVLVEEQHDGHDYRIIVVAGRVVSVTMRRRASVIGDGHSTVLELIREKNKERAVNPYLAAYPIPEDVAALDALRGAGLDLEHVPADGAHLVLRGMSNLAAGGDSIDVTDHVHPQFRDIAVRAVAAVPGIEYGGVDVITADISAPAERYIVGEVEFSPGPGPHFPVIGQPRDMGGAILDYYLERRQETGRRRSGPRTGSRAPIGGSASPTVRSAPLRLRAALLTPLDHRTTSGRADRAPADPGRLTEALSQRIVAQAGEHGIDPSEVRRRAYGATDDSGFAHSITRRPDGLSQLLESSGVFCCRAVVLGSDQWDGVKEFVAAAAGPYTLAPLYARHGRGVFRGLTQLETEWARLTERAEQIVVAQAPERFAIDVLTVDGVVVATILRVPAGVRGDGVSTVRQLVDRKAKLRSANPYLQQFPLPASVTRPERLRARGIDPDAVPRRLRPVGLGTSPSPRAGADTVGLRFAPGRGLERIAGRVVTILGSPRVAAVSFAARSVAGSRRPRWAVADVNLDPPLGWFAWPSAGWPQPALADEILGRCCSTDTAMT
jgi:D-alanine-D-alanine ligase-like ATP-grasp enzyme